MLIKPKENYTKKANPKHWLRKHPNLMRDNTVTKTEQYFVSDITYIKSRERTHYLSLLTDAFSRKIMEYHIGDDMNSEIVVQAMQMTTKNRVITRVLIHHSDRGLQYCSYTYQNEQ